jgi:hypothetical protein
MLTYDRILLSYAEVLMHWDALQARAEVGKRICVASFVHVRTLSLDGFVDLCVLRNR